MLLSGQAGGHRGHAADTRAEAPDQPCCCAGTTTGCPGTAWPRWGPRSWTSTECRSSATPDRRSSREWLCSAVRSRCRGGGPATFGAAQQVTAWLVGAPDDDRERDGDQWPLEDSRTRAPAGRPVRPSPAPVQPYPSSRRLATAAMRAGRRMAPMIGLASPGGPHSAAARTPEGDLRPLEQVDSGRDGDGDGLAEGWPQCSRTRFDGGCIAGSAQAVWPGSSTGRRPGLRRPVSDRGGWSWLRLPGVAAARRSRFPRLSPTMKTAGIWFPCSARTPTGCATCARPGDVPCCVTASGNQSRCRKLT